jgi:hypothetical protein
MGSPPAENMLLDAGLRIHYTTRSRNILFPQQERATMKISDGFFVR